jgi:two-component system NtrC family sensor kinase
MLRRITSRLVLNFRVVMLIVTSLLLFLGVVSVYNQINHVEPYLGLIAVRGESFIHITTDGSGVVERQSEIEKLSEDELKAGNRQLLIELEAKAQLEDGQELLISWSSDHQVTINRFEERRAGLGGRETGRRGLAPRREGGDLLYELRRGDELTDIWLEGFDDYGAMFDRVVSDIGSGGGIDVTYQPRIPSEGGFDTESLSVIDRGIPASFSYYLMMVVGFAFLAVGFIVYFSGASRRVPNATHFFFVCLLFFVSLAYQFTISSAPLSWVIFWLDKAAFVLTPVVLFHFFYLFSRDGFDRPWTGKTLLIYVPPVILFATNVFLLNYLALPFGRGPERVTRFPDLYLIVQRLEIALFALYVVAGLVVLLRAFRATDSVEKKIQLKWLFWGVVLGLLPTILLAFPIFVMGIRSETISLITSFPLLVLPVCLAFAVFRYKLMDVEVVFKRGFVYFISSFSVVAVYFLLMFGMNIFGGAVGTQALIIISGVMILLATLFSHRIKDNVQSMFDRILYSDFYHFRRTLQRFSQELSYERDLDRLLAKISGRIRETFSLNVVLIFILSPDRRRYMLAHRSVEIAGTLYLGEESSDWLRERLLTGAPQPVERMANPTVAEAFRLNGVTTLIPFLSLGEVIGFMALGNKADGDILNSEDLALLASLAGRAAITVDNAILYLDLQRRAEELRSLKEFSESIVESIDSGVCVVDPQGLVRRWNTGLERISGRSRELALGQPVLHLLPAPLPQLLAPYLLTGGDESGRMHNLYKIRLSDATGQEKVVNISLAPLGEVEGFSGTVMIIDDVTDWVSLEEQMQQRDRLASLGLLAAGVAHEVNTPLTGISSYVQMLQRKLQGNGEARRLLEKVDDQAFRASRIINSLLNFSRGAVSENDEVDFNVLIMDTLTLVDNQLSSASVRVVTELEGELDKIVGDRGKLQQVLINLLLNARDSMPEGGEIRITTRRLDGSISCAISDTGVGIEPENLGRIYDPFFTTKKRGRGTGLGLSVSYGIIQEHAGAIEVESEVGVGTTFTLNLPVRAAMVEKEVDKSSE